MSTLQAPPTVSAVVAVALLAVTACSEDPIDAPLTQEDENPIPTLSTVSPQEIPRGAPEQVVIVTGAGFVEGAAVRVGPQTRPTSYVDATRLEATLAQGFLLRAASHSVTAINPSPGGGPSNELTLHVVNPLPVVDSLGSTEALVGSDSLVLAIYGSGFVPDSEARVEGEARATDLVAPGVLQVVIDSTDLGEPALLQVVVSNEEPGGGSSQPATLEIVNPTPLISTLPSRGATAGGPGFPLYIHGHGFVDGSVVQWNGEDLPTTRLTSTRLRADVAAGHVATPGTAIVGVVTPPPGGGAASTELTVRPVASATVTSRANYALVGRDLVSDPMRGRLYVTLPDDAPAYPNQLLEIDPFAPQIVDSTFVGEDPSRLALADGTGAVYVGLDGSSSIRRVDLDGLIPSLLWSLPAGQYAGDMVTVPGQPSAAIVSRARFRISPPLDGITVYDDGNPRPESIGGWVGGDALTMAGSADMLYGLNNRSTTGEFSSLAVDEAGIRHVRTTNDLFFGLYTDIVGVAGRIYGTDGSVVDAELHLRVGGLGPSFAVLPDPETGRAHVLDGDDIHVYDMNTFVLLGSIPVGPVGGYGDEADRIPTLVRWGDDGLAFLSSSLLVILRSPIVGP